MSHSAFANRLPVQQTLLGQLGDLRNVDLAPHAGQPRARPVSADVTGSAKNFAAAG
jgi:hypothetical protein